MLRRTLRAFSFLATLAATAVVVALAAPAVV